MNWFASTPRCGLGCGLIEGESRWGEGAADRSIGRTGLIAKQATGHGQGHCRGQGRGPGTRQRGQALTEFAVAAVVLVPLFVLMPMVGKYLDIAHHTLMASRYVAFDATVRNDRANTWKPEAQLAQEVRRRFFGNPRNAIKADDQPGDFEADRNGLWVDPFGKPLITRFDQDVTVSFGPHQAPGHGDAFSPADDGQAFGIAHPFGLSARGVYSAQVSVALANLPAGNSLTEPFDRIDLTMSRTTAVLIDPWSAASPSQVQDRLGSVEVNPGMALAPVRPALNLVIEALDGRLIFAPDRLSQIRAPRLGDLAFWSDVVPPDRLR